MKQNKKYFFQIRLVHCTLRRCSSLRYYSLLYDAVCSVTLYSTKQCARIASFQVPPRNLLLYSVLHCTLRRCVPGLHIPRFHDDAVGPGCTLKKQQGPPLNKGPPRFLALVPKYSHTVLSSINPPSKVTHALSLLRNKKQQGVRGLFNSR